MLCRDRVLVLPPRWNPVGTRVELGPPLRIFRTVCNLRNELELAPFVQIQRHGRRYQKYVSYPTHPLTYHLSEEWTQKHPSLPSRDPTFLRSRGRILDDHPLLRTLVKLVTSLRRFVYISLSATPLLQLSHFTNMMLCVKQH